MVRADSGYYRRGVAGAALAAKAWFSITARMNPKVKAAITSIEQDAWTPIKYPHAVFDELAGRWVSDAEIAEVAFTAFTSYPKTAQVNCRLVVRRVKRLQPLAATAANKASCSPRTVTTRSSPTPR